MECEETKSFLAKLAHWDDAETEEKLMRRVEFRSVSSYLLLRGYHNEFIEFCQVVVYNHDNSLQNFQSFCTN